MHLRAIAGGRQATGTAGETRRHANVERLLNGDLRDVIHADERSAICEALPMLVPMSDERRKRVREHVLELYSGFKLYAFSGTYERTVDLALKQTSHPEHALRHIKGFLQRLHDGNGAHSNYRHAHREAFLKAVFVSILLLP